jgi:hypothetical protein
MKEVQIIIEALTMALEVGKEAKVILDSEAVKNLENEISKLIDWVREHRHKALIDPSELKKLTGEKAV